MNLSPVPFPEARRPSRSPGRDERGSAVIVVLILVAIVLIYIAFNIRTLYCLSGDLRLIEQKQTRRWSAIAQTNNVAATNALVRPIPVRTQP